jgi:hypothetical protein
MTGFHGTSGNPTLEQSVKIEAGYDIAFNCFQDVPLILMLSVHPSRRSDLPTEHKISFSPNVASRDYLDVFGNVCTRVVAPAGIFEICNRFILADSGQPDEIAPAAEEWDIDQFPDDALTFWEAATAIPKNSAI